MLLLIPITLNIIYSVGFYFIDKYSSFKKLPYIVKQIIIGVVFATASISASEFGVAWLGTVINVRDSAPLTAGFLFGGPAGIIAGCIGGLYRWVSVAWGAGMYSRLACTLASILAGFMAAGYRKFMFDSKRVTLGYGVCITVLCEVLHMVLIFITNIKDAANAFELVKGVTVPMIIGNCIAVGLSITFVSLLSRQKLIGKSEHISQTFQRWLLICIVIAFIATGIFTFILQDGIASVEIQKIFTSAVNDVKEDIKGKSDDYLIDKAQAVAARYEENPDVQLDMLAAEFGVIEINIVREDGLIVKSTDKQYINSFDMNSTEQSKEFMVLTEGESVFAQEYGPVGSNENVFRKFAGVSLEDGGFIQVGYSAEQFHRMLDAFVIDVTKNRHLSSSGFIMVCDESLKIVADSEWNGKSIFDLGIEKNEEILSGHSSTHLSKSNLINVETGSKEDCFYAYSFVEGYCILAAMPTADAMFMRDSSLYTSVFMQVIIFGTLLVLIYFLIKIVIIDNITKINKSLSQISSGNLDVTVNLSTNTEFASLSADINTTVATLKQYIAEAAARIDKELEYAKQIQLSALPVNFPTKEDFEVYAQMIAAKEVGGDFYDFYKIDSNTVAFLVADVSGKGIPAAMFMMTAKTIIKDLAERGLPVNEIFTLANDKLCESNESGMFVTAWMGILDLTTGKLQFSNAGHNPPLIKRVDGQFEYLRSRAGFVLAGMDGVRYRVNEMELNPGDRIFLYTDGVPEATNTENQLFNEDRLLDFMNKNCDMKSTELFPILKATIDEFVGDAPQFDDITMLMFDYKSRKGGTVMTKKMFPAKIESLNEVIGFIEQALETFECSMKIQTALCVAIEEVFVNVAHYAYGEGEGDVEFAITFDSQARDITFRMSDEGVPFDPLKKPDPDITLSAEDRQIGGLGIFITKKTMDFVSYAYEDGKNVLTMIKKI